MIYGYARVSSKDQNADRQVSELIDWGVKIERIYIDKQSGKDFARINYSKLIKSLKRKDTLVIKSIDRLGRDYSAIINEWQRITTDIKANIVVLDMPLLDTRDKENSLMGKFISDIVLQILSFVAENERNSIKSRQAEGIAVAKLKGVEFGRPKKPLPSNYDEVAYDYLKKNISLNEALEKTQLAKSTFFKYFNQYFCS